MKIRSFAVALLLLACADPVHAAAAYNEVGVDFPLEGGGLVTYARMWRLNKFVHVGGEIGGGRIVREFEMAGGGREFDVETDTLVLPFVGPRAAIHIPGVALSLGFSWFRAETDVEARSPGLETLTGEAKGWGTAIHSPFFVLDFYDKKRKMVFGFGVGGFFGTSFEDLEARSSSSRLVTDENPLDTITIHFRTMWGTGTGPAPVEEL